GNLQSIETAIDRSGAAADGRARSRRSRPQRDFQRSHRAYSGVRHEAPRIRIPRIDAGGESEVLLCDSAAPGCLPGASGAASVHRLRAALLARHYELSGTSQDFPVASRPEYAPCRERTLRGTKRKPDRRLRYHISTGRRWERHAASARISQPRERATIAD